MSEPVIIQCGLTLTGLTNVTNGLKLLMEKTNSESARSMYQDFSAVLAGALFNLAAEALCDIHFTTDLDIENGKTERNKLN